MDLRSGGRKLSFEVLSSTHLGEEYDDEESLGNGPFFPRSNSDPLPGHESDSLRGKRKHRRKNKNKNKNKKQAPCSIIPESPDSDHGKTAFSENGNGHVPNGVKFDCRSCSSGLSQVVVLEQPAAECQSNNLYGFGELRQRSVGNIGTEEADAAVSSVTVQSRLEDKDVGFEVAGKQHNSGTPSGGGRVKLETIESLDWKRVMSEDPHCLFQVERSPLKYFMEEMRIGNSLRGTTTPGNEKERERVYDTIFRLPWRCELLIDVGVFVCFDSFLSLLTIMPARILTVIWKSVNMRQLKKPSAAELSDLGCFIVLICGVTLLQQIDISLIYHMIRGQGTIKLYVVYNVLEAVTLSACIVAHNNALLALLVSNNFAEIKSNVFKRFSKDNIHSIVYYDSVERFHITAFVLFVLAQNILEAEDPWFESFLFNAMLVYVCEIAIDIIKHSFIAKFNDIKPIAYSEFLEDLCKQTLNIQTNTKNNLTFVPLAPACVVIRVLTPVYAAHLPYSPLPWRLFWILVLFAITYVMLASLKVMVHMGLQKHAAWYVKRCEKRKLHSD
ncbi:hypothetical protein CDL15_Pgr010725 [Punica granatum]|uniref:Protein POLLEN DEFECTIVE IN GUIDANCE 1 n=1 Tax=Punica granatum TaxID=22663 RepID=A0A218W5M4_PUNGR|nr:hypothetical protein CDL15_Pgr010725 [Punica granatum]